MQKPIDFLAIGDITTDAFITLEDASVHCDINNDDCTICMRFGDKVPYKKVDVVPAVGNSANASVAAARLGLNAAFLGWIGDDQNGKDCVEALQHDKVDTSLVQTEAGKPTNYHYVLSFNAERTILVNHTEFNYQLPELTTEPKLVYLSSLAPNSLPYHEQIADYLEAHPNVLLAFQPGTFQMKLGYEKMKRMYQRSDLFFCNVQEAQRILETTNDDIKHLLSEMHARGPKIAVITDGPKGAYAYDGTDYYQVPMYPDPQPPVERTGAGDSFSSTFTAFYAAGMSIEDCLLRAPINSMSVVQYVGAQKGLLTKEQIDDYLAKKPDYYIVKKI